MDEIHICQISVLVLCALFVIGICIGVLLGKDSVAERIKKQIGRLRLADGDMIVVKLPNLSRRDVEELEGVFTRIKEDTGVNVAIVVIPDDGTIENLTEGEMADLGWYRHKEV